MSYRRAIFNFLPSEVKSSLWVEYISHLRSTRVNLSGHQVEVLGEIVDVASDGSIFQDAGNSIAKQKVKTLEGRVVAAFGEIEAQEILRTLGGNESTNLHQLPLAVDCACNTADDWCSGCPNQKCTGGGCTTSTSGCGSLWVKECNGLCKCP
ncbi:bacteriocin fulvocin C-related protein [Prauserella salsuginis]